MKMQAGNEVTYMQREKKWYGGVPDGVESSAEVLALFEEVEETTANIDHVRAIFNQQIGSLSTGLPAYLCRTNVCKEVNIFRKVKCLIRKQLKELMRVKFEKYET